MGTESIFFTYWVSCVVNKACGNELVVNFMSFFLNS